MNFRRQILKGKAILNRSSIQELVVIKSNLEMGRKKISIKPILSAQGRKITYNKRKVGLLKKVVEISAMCGVSVSLEFEDTDGNIIKIKALDGNIEKKNPPLTENTFLLTPKDYPTFGILPQVERKPRRVIKKRPRLSSDEVQSSSKEKIEEEVPSNPNRGEKTVPTAKSDASTSNCLPQLCAFEPKPQPQWLPMPTQMEFTPIFHQPQPQTQWFVAPVYPFQPQVFPPVLW